MKKLLTLLFSVIIFAACDSGKYDQVAYYKDDAKMRVFVYVTDETDLNELKKHAKKQMHTDGATTAVFYYNELIGSTKSVTMAPNFHEALGRACTKWCVAGYWKYANGGEAFNAKPCEKE